MLTSVEFISKQRRLSQKKGLGVQYLPGHVEPFVDLVINNYLPKNGKILDLGGGGLRFALPVALKGRKVSVVDLDRSGLDVEMVVNRVNQNDGTRLDAKDLLSRIEIYESDVLDFLRANSQLHSLITSFRVAHFMRPHEIPELFRLIHRALDVEGIFAFSAMTLYNLPDKIEFNELTLNSEPVSSRTPLHRRFLDTAAAEKVRTGQNLLKVFHLVDSDFVSTHAHNTGFEVIVDSYQSTRIVAGFIMKKLNVKPNIVITIQNAQLRDN
jgi:SAM-dependent methyltransferase